MIDCNPKTAIMLSERFRPSGTFCLKPSACELVTGSDEQFQTPSAEISEETLAVLSSSEMPITAKPSHRQFV